MTLSEILNWSSAQLESIPDSEYEAAFSSMFNVTRPPEGVKPHSNKPVQVDLKPDIVKQAADKIGLPADVFRALIGIKKKKNK